MARDRVKYKKVRPPDPHSVVAPWRLFIAIPMPPEAVALIEDLVGTLSTEDWPVRWVAPDTAHITLHFLGDTEPERAELLRLALGPTIAEHPTFTLQTSELGAFPNEDRPRVIWLGLRGQTRELSRLHRDLADQLTELEFPVEERRLTPHITLGRLRLPPSPELAASIRRRLASPALQDRLASAPVTIPVKDVLLVRSFLERTGARHQPIARYPLATTERT